VGITGEPKQIQNYAQLVKMAAELVLEQSFLLERVQWKQGLQSEIVNQLISVSAPFKYSNPETN
jgi:carbohydrate diacid regulator